MILYPLLRSRSGALLASPILNRSVVQTTSKALVAADGSSTYNSRRFLSTDKKPFEKVLIANRGEIVERVIRTCRELEIKTVAVHSTADSKARFVAMADERVCLGPAAANKSYLDVNAVMNAMKTTGAQALHPGYGFLSENTAFAKKVNDSGAVFLGPPPSAIHALGDKIESKLIAAKAGVNCVPGYEGIVESLEQALQLCHERIKYPVLLKAAAGGGGKGMRVCYNDQDIKDAWKIAKSEALSFFSDDRLLLEKFIERPHHIEFQVMAAPGKNGGTDVVVFPERECSIQRRNQKVIEETPSCLLKPETRLAMAEQVRKLCQVVGYQSAGTVEFLVDEEQHFYFLEMNTRLQVEHPVTECVAGGIDLVKAMLYVGAGWGLPEELAPHTTGVFPYSGHAIEGRIYAEDPLRGFLPSTGPLIQYVEPSKAENTPKNYIRIDAGVEPGHVVSPYYDPMLSKLVAYGPDRKAAIATLLRGLDEYVIEGVQHNARLVQEVLRHPSFQKGDTPTSFLPTHYPDGFTGVKLLPAEEENYAVAAAAIDAARRRWLQRPPLPAGSLIDEKEHHETVIVRMGGIFGPFTYKIALDEASAKITQLERDDNGKWQQKGAERTVSLDRSIRFDPRKYLAKVTIDGEVNRIQVLREDATGEYKMQFHGADRLILIESPREFELSSHMIKPDLVDTSQYILSPMPGSLISVAVKAGDSVQIGQEMCIVEAMKMQNIIRSPRKGVVKKVNCKVGSSLKADEIIMEFEVEEAAAEAA